MPKKLVRISTIADYFGVTQQTIRRWEDKGIIRPFRIDPRSHRRYDFEEVKQKIEEIRNKK